MCQPQNHFLISNNQTNHISVQFLVWINQYHVSSNKKFPFDQLYWHVISGWYLKRILHQQTNDISKLVGFLVCSWSFVSLKVNQARCHHEAMWKDQVVQGPPELFVCYSTWSSLVDVPRNWGVVVPEYWMSSICRCLSIHCLSPRLPQLRCLQMHVPTGHNSNHTKLTKFSEKSHATKQFHIPMLKVL